jgi:hypothetical protein
MPMTRAEMQEMANDLESVLALMKIKGIDDCPQYVRLWRQWSRLEERANRFGPVG